MNIIVIQVRNEQKQINENVEAEKQRKVVSEIQTSIFSFHNSVYTCAYNMCLTVQVWAAKLEFSDVFILAILVKHWPFVAHVQTPSLPRSPPTHQPTRQPLSLMMTVGSAVSNRPHSQNEGVKLHNETCNYEGIYHFVFIFQQKLWPHLIQTVPS